MLGAVLEYCSLRAASHTGAQTSPRYELCSHSFPQSWITDLGMNARCHVTCWNFPF